jgi:PBSX family phage portal protein
MSKTNVPAMASPRVEVFSFGDPLPVMDGRDLISYMEAAQCGKWYAPPVSLEGLAKSFRCSPHHASAIYLKRNQLVSAFIPHALLDRETFSRWVLDFLVFGNAYLEVLRSRSGRPMVLRHCLAKYMRRGVDDMDVYFFLPTWRVEHEFDRGAVIHLAEPDINQEVYGLPEYLPALQSAWLNEAGTLFRRKYYLNGSHAGYILYLNDSLADEKMIDDIRKAMKESKGPGNFRNMFLYAPGGKKDGLQMIPISEVAAKDEFAAIKNVTRDDVLASHRVPPQLLGIVPTNNGGFGDVVRADTVFHVNEVQPLQARFAEINDRLGVEVVRFRPHELIAPAPGTASADA